MKVLIVDDDPKYRSFVSKGLTESGMSCTIAEDGESALKRLQEGPFDVVLLDVMMPGISGWSVLERMRAAGIQVPVIFVTARDAVDERVKGLRMGGDDYIVKPFAFDELLARIQVVGRGRRQRTELEIGDLKIDYLNGVVTRAGRKLDLTRIEYSLLKRLAESAGRPVSRAELLRSVWEIDFDPGTNVVEVQIRRLRKKVDESFAKPLIQTVRGAGYAIGE